MDALGAASLRAQWGDSERTRILKDVLRSSFSVEKTIAHEFPGIAVARDAGWKIVNEGRPGSKDKNPGSSSSSHRSSIGMGEMEIEMELEDNLQACREGDEYCTQMSIAQELTPALKRCSSRIDQLRERLSTFESKLTHAADPPRYPEDESTRIRILKRPPEDTPAAARLRVEQAAAQSLSQHARWPQLEKLSELIEESKSHEDLLKVFPPTGAQYHPNTVLLTDFALKHPEEFHRAIWQVQPREGAPTSPGARTKGGLKSPLTTLSPHRGKVNLKHVPSGP